MMKVMRIILFHDYIDLQAEFEKIFQKTKEEYTTTNVDHSYIETTKIITMKLIFIFLSQIKFTRVN